MITVRRCNLGTVWLSTRYKVQGVKSMIKIKHIVNIYVSLFNYKKQLTIQKLDEDANDIQNTIDYILDKNVAEIAPLEE